MWVKSDLQSVGFPGSTDSADELLIGLRLGAALALRPVSHTARASLLSVAVFLSSLQILTTACKCFCHHHSTPSPMYHLSEDKGRYHYGRSIVYVCAFLIRLSS